MATVADLQSRLAKIEAAIDYVLNGNAQSAQRAGRAMTALSLAELERLRSKYTWELSVAQGNAGRSVPIRFTQPEGAGVNAYDPSQPGIPAI